ncbi:MAG TPA: LytTR family DNA-binding domain-containing protein [Kofleriaceae bacterium]|nr:LytTR family DNA-binding domain-containing protein [Kofleriaceae bacterium]
MTSAIIVDDERLARRELASLLKAHPEVAIVGEAASVDEAAALLRTVEPDIVFLDIQMPRRSGFELLEAADVRGRVVFVTAHDIHAIRAFEVNALDYLLKPVHPARLAVAIRRVLAATGESRPAATRLELDDHLFLTEGRAARFVTVRAIVCIRAAGDYTEIALPDGKQLLSPRPLKEWEARLPASFARVHRTAIVNLDHVERVERTSDDAFALYVRGVPAPVPLSRRHAARLRSFG